MAERAVPVGALVVPAPGYREAMATGEGAALLLGLRRGSGHLYYCESDRAFWVPMRQVGVVPPEVVREGSRERLLSGLLLELEAEECTVEEVGPASITLVVETGSLGRDRLRGVEGALGDRLRSYAIEPGTMHSIMVRLELGGLPDAAGAG
jgi:hypothetical protein